MKANSGDNGSIASMINVNNGKSGSMKSGMARKMKTWRKYQQAYRQHGVTKAAAALQMAAKHHRP